MLRHCNWHHIPTERGGTERARKKENLFGRVIKEVKGRAKKRERQKNREQQRKGGKSGEGWEQETLEKTACKYAKSGPLKWRWRGDRIKSSEHCVITDQFAAIKPPYGWSLWNGEISAPQGQPWWQWRSQTMGVTDWDTYTEGDENEVGGGGGGKVLAHHQYSGLRFLIMLTGKQSWNTCLWPSLPTEQTATRVNCGAAQVTQVH